MNQPSRYELFALGEDEERLVVTEDTKIPHAATITINKEDHTLANMLRSQLLTFPEVLFAGYRVPHPLEPAVVIKVQTDGSISPLQAVQEASKQLIMLLGRIRDQFQNELLKARAMGGEGDNGDFYGARMEGVEGQGGGFL